jgi:hypothetical protein
VHASSAGALPGSLIAVTLRSELIASQSERQSRRGRCIADCNGAALPVQPAEGIVADYLAACCFGMKIRQDPCGLMVPSTILQAFGGWNCTHLSQRLSPCGWS